MQRLCIWLPKDTLLYLPVYALADLGILARVVEAAKLKHALSLEIMPAPDEGDEQAISHMLKMASSARDGAIHIAIADPVAAYIADPKGSSVALLGAFIKRPTFWVLGRDVAPGMEEAKRKYVYYEEEFITGNFVGRRLSANVEETLRKRCRMGEEFKYFTQPESYVGQLRVVTADIVGMVSCMAADTSIKIKETLMERYPRFLTTGVLCHRDQLKAFGPEISALLEAIRSACALFRTAQRPAAALLRQVIQDGPEAKAALDGKILTAPEAETLAEVIAERLFSDHVYSDTLAIDIEDWKQATKARGLDEERAASRLFYKIYKPQFANSLTAQWLISTFQDYGRFVQEARAFKSGVAATTFALLLSQILLIAVIEAPPYDPFAQRALIALSWSSGVVALGAIVWVLLALLSMRTRLFLPIQRVLSIDENATFGITLSIITLAGGTIALAFANIFHPLEFGAHYILWVTSGLVALGGYCYKIIKQRNA